MAQKTRTILKSYFNTGDRPTEGEFVDFIDSTINLTDDKATDAEAIDPLNNSKFITPKSLALVVTPVQTALAGKEPSIAVSTSEKYFAGDKTFKDFATDVRYTTLIGLPTLNGAISESDKIIEAFARLQNQIISKQDKLISANPPILPAIATPNAKIKTVDGISLLITDPLSTATDIIPRASKFITPRNINGVPFDGSIDIVTQKIFNLTTANTQGTTTRVNIPDLSFTAVAGKKYKIEIIGDYQSAAVATGGSLGFIMSSGTATIKGFATMAVSIVAPANNLALSNSITAINSVSATANSFITSSGVSSVGSPHSLYTNLILTCTTGGVFQVQWGSKVTAATTLNAGTTMIVTQLN